MHISDGLLAAPVWAGLGAVSAASVSLISRRVAGRLEEGRAPLLGVMGAFVFAAQMINFPVAAGTSGHLVGSALLAAVLGPGAASLVMTAILLVQALVFQDGGILALGANVFNMALVGVWAGYLPYRHLAATGWRTGGVFLGGLTSVIAASCLAILELRLSIPVHNAIVTASLGWFLVSALIEGAITAAVFQSMQRMNPGWVEARPGGASRIRGVLAAGAVLLASVGAVLASSLPDGLEKLLEDAGAASLARTLVSTPLADYEVQFLASPWIRTAGAGLAGLAIIFSVCALGARYVRRKNGGQSR